MPEDIVPTGASAASRISKVSSASHSLEEREILKRRQFIVRYHVRGGDAEKVFRVVRSQFLSFVFVNDAARIRLKQAGEYPQQR
jgi:hypothetical protein